MSPTYFVSNIRRHDPDSCRHETDFLETRFEFRNFGKDPDPFLENSSMTEGLGDKKYLMDLGA